MAKTRMTVSVLTLLLYSLTLTTVVQSVQLTDTAKLPPVQNDVNLQLSEPIGSQSASSDDLTLAKSPLILPVIKPPVDIVGGPVAEIPVVVAPVPELSRQILNLKTSNTAIVSANLLKQQPGKEIILPAKISYLQDLVVFGEGPLWEYNAYLQGDLNFDNDRMQTLSDEVASGGRLWDDNTVYYNFKNDVSKSLQTTIRDAMDHWSDNTCLKFVPRTTQSDFVQFRTTDTGCYSDQIGKNGGQQNINLGSGCEFFGIAVHEIGHALGLWHEQSRPDRDGFVRILTQNIQSGKGSQFDKKDEDDDDTFGSDYDYGSIMHYSLTSFSKDPAHLDTIQVTNNPAFLDQGSPTIGQRSFLSFEDIQQIRHRYNCKGTGIAGTLKVYIRYAKNLPDTDPWPSGDDDAYVDIYLVTAAGTIIHQQSSVKDDSNNPTWDQLINFGPGTFQYFKMKLWDSDSGFNGGDDRLSWSTSVTTISGGNHYNLKHCVNIACTSYMIYDYYFQVDTNDCSPNHCQHGSTCFDLINDYTCACPTGYTGKNCEFINKRLQVYARYGKNLPDEDSWPAGDSDSYMEVVAAKQDGSTVRKVTSVKDDNLNPVWNQNLDFGVGDFTMIHVRLWDSDSGFNGGDDPMSNVASYPVTPGSFPNTKICAPNVCTGYAIFDYSFL